MNFGGHLMSGWLISRGTSDAAERRLVMLSAIAPDADGLFILGPESWREAHRTFGHNIFWAILVPLILLVFVRRGRRWRLLPLLFAGMASHFVLDLFVTGWWSLVPFWPISDWDILMSRYIPEHVMKYHIQIGLFAALLVPVVWFVRKEGRSPLEILGVRADRFFLNFITMPFSQKCSVCGARAFYRCEACNAPLCGRHRRFSGWFRTRCSQPCRHADTP
ncbi:MAG TPA: metal-dependent hydrolase [Candidatus Sumerlaeota bacterium]|nr:metal-dependent hydrolase [Candidatus Sumerlaeota bacterium]